MSTVMARSANASDPAASDRDAVPAHVLAVVFASLAVLVGVIWDISWHQSIGRDTLFSAPHLAIYLGGVVAGIACGWTVLKTTFAGSAQERAGSVSFWKVFRGPLGAWVCIWGAFAMLTSAPFDDWWHGAFGLDTKILSPPHALLAAGIGAINLGAILMVAPLANRAGPGRRTLALLYAVSFGLLLLMAGTMSSEYHYRIYMHGAPFYIAAAVAFPLILAAAARSAPLVWPATTTAAVYSIVTLVMMWILPLFAAEPRLAPIQHPVTHMVPPSFPLLLIVPAILFDLAIRRVGGMRDSVLALILGVVFVVSLTAVQVPFATFLMSDLAQNPLFAGDNFPYQVSHDSFYYRRLFVTQGQTTADTVLGLLVAIVVAAGFSRAGLAWGGWLRRVRR